MLVKVVPDIGTEFDTSMGTANFARWSAAVPGAASRASVENSDNPITGVLGCDIYLTPARMKVGFERPCPFWMMRRINAKKKLRICNLVRA
jgi:hypothetical protein